MAELDNMLEARRAAIARGDKALGREIYHQIQTQYGLQGHEIDATNDGSELPEPSAGAAVTVETADADPAPETATPPKAKRTRKRQG